MSEEGRKKVEGRGSVDDEANQSGKEGCAQGEGWGERRDETGRERGKRR